MSEGRVGANHVAVSCETRAGRFELRLYDGTEAVASSWWIGMFDRDGGLRRTWISNGAEPTFGALQTWLRPIVGYEASGRLARMALHVQGRSVEEGDRTRVVRLSGRFGEPAAS